MNGEMVIGRFVKVSRYPSLDHFLTNLEISDRVEGRPQPTKQNERRIMKKHDIIETPPNPFKKGGPSSHLEEGKRDGEQPQSTFLSSDMPTKSPKEKPPKKEEK